MTLEPEDTYLSSKKFNQSSNRKHHASINQARYYNVMVFFYVYVKYGYSTWHSISHRRPQLRYCVEILFKDGSPGRTRHFCSFPFSDGVIQSFFRAISHSQSRCNIMYHTTYGEVVSDLILRCIVQLATLLPVANSSHLWRPTVRFLIHMFSFNGIHQSQ